MEMFIQLILIISDSNAMRRFSPWICVTVVIHFLHVDNQFFLMQILVLQDKLLHHARTNRNKLTMWVCCAQYIDTVISSPIRFGLMIFCPTIKSYMGNVYWYFTSEDKYQCATNLGWQLFEFQEQSHILRTWIWKGHWFWKSSTPWLNASLLGGSISSTPLKSSIPIRSH